MSPKFGKMIKVKKIKTQGRFKLGLPLALLSQS
jgi:hypothetical protein